MEFKDALRLFETYREQLEVEGISDFSLNKFKIMF